MDACYSINRKGGYVTIYNNGYRYPLDIWNELKAQHDLSHQQLANEMFELWQKDNEGE